ncbi:MBL fold metallo-hydrolase [Glycomyces mayteni]|uniref:MBL fold metallo-hydrolase n=1 Tax=Glycomyces mayteni TaxID=543887 RepID=A0ABW2D8A1_9ACTN|nr:MBL fold metallo-hydrolase [Glycomyces mayteni]
MTPTLDLGTHQIIALTDGVGPFLSARDLAFPDATPEQWADADALDPDAVDADGEWILQFRAFAIRSDRGVTLVDTGIGPAGAPAESWTPVPGRLPEELAAAGVDPAEVTNVVLTHLHSDHIGWAVVGDDKHPYFPNAEYLLQRNEFEAVEAINPKLEGQIIAPLLRADRLRLLDGDTPLPSGEQIVATPGHTPGHQSVLVRSGRDLAVVTGDLLVHAIQLAHPGLEYAHEMDRPAAKRSREAILATDADLHLATPHLTAPFTRYRP